MRRYDDMKTAQENIDLQTTILSRFDLIFIVKDERSMERDKRIAQHVIQVHRDAGSAPEADEEDKKVQLMLTCRPTTHTLPIRPQLVHYRQSGFHAAHCPHLHN